MAHNILTKRPFSKRPFFFVLTAATIVTLFNRSTIDPDQVSQGDLEFDQEAIDQAEYEASQVLLAEGYKKDPITKALALKHFDVDKYGHIVSQI